MLSGATCKAAEMAGTAVFRIVVSSDTIKNATATSHGSRRLLETAGGGVSEGALGVLSGGISSCSSISSSRFRANGFDFGPVEASVGGSKSEIVLASILSLNVAD